MTEQTTDNRIDRMLKRVLKPLVKFLLNRGITYTAVSDALKSIYVEVASESAQIEGKRLTDSRVSLVTGIHRKEVKRLRELLAQEDEIPLGEIQASLGASVMAKWLSTSDYLDENNQPLVIAKTGESPSFEALVYSISKDKHFRSLLDDWVTQGIASVDEGRVTLLQRGLVPSEDDVEKLYFAGKNLGAHIETVTHNLKGSIDPMFDRAVFYKNLPVSAVNEIEEEAKRRNLETLTHLNDMAAQARGDSASQDESTADFHVGAYFHKKARD